MFRVVTLLVFIVCAAPSCVSAAVVINEIAWMGSGESPNDEWMELFNDGADAISLDEWMLTDNVSLEIVLTGAVGAGAFALLERTDDTSAPGSAFLIYTGALANDGRTLTLRRADGSIEDQIAGGENWENIGGDNTTKDTAQRTDAGWITAQPTPGQANETVNSAPVQTESSAKTSTKSTADDTKKPEKISLIIPDHELSLSVTAPTVAFVHQEVRFTAEGGGIGQSLLDSLTYHWNFGDTYTGSGKEVVHSFAHPGEYLVIVSAEYARHNALARHHITVLPRALTLSKTTDDTITIANNASFESDVSGFVLQGDTRITFPNNTYLLPNTSITLDASRVQKGIVKTVALLDIAGNIVALYTPNLESRAKTEVSTTTPYLGNELIVVENADPSEMTVAEENQLGPQEEADGVTLQPGGIPPGDFSEETEDTVLGNTNSASVGKLTSAKIPSKLPYYGLIGVLLLSILALYTTRTKPQRDLP